MSDESSSANDVAIVGMACRFPGARTLEQYWDNLCRGVESVRRFTDEELAAFGVPQDVRRQPNFVPVGAPVPDPDMFDHAFWGLSPREAALTDPQQRLFLETAWESLEHAGCDPYTYDGLIGVYAGMGLSTYLLFNLIGNPALTDADTQVAMLGNDKDFLTTRAAYLFNLRGPSISVQTGCSTSLVAAHLACDALLSHQCDVAVVGGSTVGVPQRTGYLHVTGGTASPDGHTRSFDAGAAGTVFGSGVGVVVLKRLADALDARDTIYAVITGSAVNNDGANKVGFTAPSVAGQAEVIVRAHSVAGIDPRTIDYVEAHGTATSLGDPMELLALTQAFRAGTEDRAFCALGSVKTNIGHADTAAGVAGLIKTALSLYHGQIPPSLHFTAPNPGSDLAASPFYVNTQLRAWPAGGAPRRAGVSAFGFGGTNAHLVLQEPPPQAPSAPLDDERPQLLVLSAKSAAALEQMSANLAAHLADCDSQSLGDIAYTLQAGRAVHDHRRAVVCRDRAGAAAALAGQPAADTGPVHTAYQREHGRRVAFMLPGLGEQYTGMGRLLYRELPVFRDTVDRCAEILRPLLGLDIRDVLYPPQEPGTPSGGGLDLRTMLRGAASAEALQRTAVAHPAVFVVDYALARQWMAWGVLPSALIGHSLGEYVAATLAGVFQLEDALRLVAGRAALIDRLPPGAMLAVPMAPQDLRGLLGGDLAVALVNDDRMSVVSGSEAAVAELQERLTGQGVVCRRLQATRAFHSPLMTPIVGEYVELVRSVPLSPPRLPYISNVTGTWATEADATDPAYWGEHTVQTVQFADGMRRLDAEHDGVLLEVGPGQALSTLAAGLCAPDRLAVVQSMRAAYDHRLDDVAFLLDALGRLWVGGVDVDWSSVHPADRPRRVALPTYPFDRQRAWIAPPGAAPARPAAHGRRTATGEWFFARSWHSAAVPLAATAAPEAEGERWLVVADDLGLAERLVTEAAAAGRPVASVWHADAFARLGPGQYRTDTADPGQAKQLARALADDGFGALTHVVHLAALDGAAAVDGGFAAAQRRGFFSVVELMRALGEPAGDGRLEWWIVADGLASVGEDDPIRPEKATLFGPAMVIPQEYERVTVRMVDVRPALEPDLAALALRLRHAIDDPPRERMFADRGRRRWVPEFRPAQLARTAPRPLRRHGVYLITGGLGRIGLDIAEHLVAQVQARVVLLGRSPFPSPERWAALRDDDRFGATIRRLERLQEQGGEVMVVSADVADEAAMRSAASLIAARFGPLHGIVHAAGLTGQEALVMLEQLGDHAELQFRAKALGVYVLDEVFGAASLDFTLLLSSNAALLGGLGTGVYAAGNAFLDAFAQHRWSGTGRRWISVNLEEWLSRSPAAAQRQTSFTTYALSADEGIACLQRIVESAPGGHLSVITGDLDERLDRWVRHPETARVPVAGDGRSRAPRPALETEFAAPADEIERVVAEVWQEILGIERIGRDDNYYALGGHSLLATQIVTRVRTVLGVDLTLLSLLGAPTVAGFADSVRRAAPVREDAGPALVPVPRGGPLPVSYAQRRFWFFEQLVPGNAFYNIPDVVRITGPLQPVLLHRAVNRIVARHEALRTTLQTIDGAPAQVIADGMELPLPVLDLSELAGDEQRSRVGRLAGDEARTAFDLAAGPLIRVTALRLRADEHIVLLTMHHSVADAWSTGIFIAELRALYAAYAEGTAESLPPLPVQYADFAAWQLQRLAAAGPGLLDYWRAALEGAPALLPLPSDRPRPAVQRFAGAVLPVTLPPDLVDRLRQLGNQENCTLFMTLLTAFTCVLHRYTAETDLVIGSPIAGRVRSELENLIGSFVNMLPLRTVVDPAEAFVQLLRRVRETTLGAFAHQELPFEMLVEALRPDRDLAHNPVFQVVFALQNAPLPELGFAGLHVEQVQMPATLAKFDLMLMLRETGGGAEGVLEYSTDLFDEQTVARLGKSFLTLLDDVVRRPGCAVGDLALMPAADMHEVLAGHEVGPSVPLPSRSIPELLAEQAARCGPAVAVTEVDPAGGEVAVLSFAELDARSNQVAHYLRSLGIGRGSRVGVSLRRGADAVTVVLGVLKAGAAYVPIDPGYPSERRAYMLTSARVALLVTEAGAACDHDVESVDAAQLWRAAGARPDLPVTGRPVPADPAYVIYTSGSTGTPKGVVGLHGGMLNRLDWMWREFPFDGDEVLCQKTSLSFLDSFWEIFGPLCQGVPIVVIPDESLTDPDRMVDLLARHRVTRLVLVPSLLRLLLNGVPDLDRRVPRLRLWTSSGEPLPPELAEAFVAKLPGRRLLNLYGSSEVAADVTYHEITGADVERGVVPIGRPIANTTVRVADGTLRPAPTGVEGDLYVGGVALAAGYLGRADLTAESFVPDPLGWPGGTRLYRTGDRARRREDGVIEYLGRRDRQVKVRGFRVELTEVEAALCRAPAVAQAAVTADGDRLVAYCVPVDGDTFDPSATRRFLQTVLPNYMVPSAFVPIGGLPLTPSGKVDRAALPAAARLRPEPAVSSAPPDTATGQVVAALWAEVLDLPEVGADDDFFAVGGHSLLATRLVARIRETLATELELRLLFEYPTVAGLTATLLRDPDRAGEIERRAATVMTVAAFSDEEVEALLQVSGPGGDVG